MRSILSFLASAGAISYPVLMVRRGVVLLGSFGLVGACAALGLSSTGTNGTAQTAAASQRPTQLGQTTSVRSAEAVTVVPQSEAGPACSKEMALVGEACMDRYEAHLLVPEADGSFSEHPPHARPLGEHFVAAARASVKPQAYISQIESASACANAGKRLCSVVEWYAACSGSSATTYPYGAKYEAGRCNSGKPHLLSVLHGANALSWKYAHFNDPALARQPGFLALTGEYAGCTSQHGVHDLVGNLHEWVADRVDPSLANKLPVAASMQQSIRRNTGNGVFMGGFFSTTSEHGPGCTFVTAAHEPRYHDYSTGFRCCRDPSVR